jgi:succinoglycan biosynthesis transport protein ExoP
MQEATVRDRSIDGLPSQLDPAAFAPDPTNRLEPLGVPLGRLGGILGRHYWIVLLTVLLGAGGTAGLITSMPKQYTGVAAILIEPRRTQVSDLQAISPDPVDVSSMIRTQIDILQSPSLMMGVVEALHLEDDLEFVQASDSPVALISGTIHRLLAVGQPATPPPTPQQRIELAASALSGKIGFGNELRSSVLQVMVTTRNPTLSARIANEVARQFLRFKREEKFAAMQRAHDWLQDQLGGLAEQMRTTEAAVQQYRAQHGLIDLPDDGTSGALHATSVIRQQLSEVASELTQVSQDRAEKEARLAQAQAAMDGQHIATLPDVLKSPVILQLLQQETLIVAHEAQLASSEGNGNPELVAVRAQLLRVHVRIGREMANVILSLNTEVRSARAEEAALRQRMGELREAVGVENSAEVGLQGLQAKARATRNLYDSFLTRATELANVAGIQEPDASLVSSATPPLGPSAPRPLRFVAVATLLSSVLGVGLACFIERVCQGFVSPDQLQACLGIPSITMVPNVSRKSRVRSCKGRKAIKFAASLDKLRGRLRTLGDACPKIIMISSALPQEGKTVFATSMSQNLATAGWRVLLMDCDFRRPTVAKHFALPLSPGLSEILAGGLLAGNQTALHEVQPRLDVLTAGAAGDDPQELLASDRMAKLLAAVREQYDVVILDTAPVIPVSDALVLARHVDATLMIIHWEKTPRNVVQDGVRLLRSSNAEFLGTVLNRVNLRRAAQSAGRPARLYDYTSGYPTRRI